jgi:hypothetical protein
MPLGEQEVKRMADKEDGLVPNNRQAGYLALADFGGLR